MENIRKYAREGSVRDVKQTGVGNKEVLLVVKEDVGGQITWEFRGAVRVVEKP
jgi:hypothetical protein